MAYIELQDLLDRLGRDKLVELTDNNETGEVDEIVVSDAIESAKGEFESYIRQRYALPVPVTSLVRSLNLKIAVFALIEGRATLDEGIYKVHQNAYKSAVALLINISNGKAALDVPASEETIELPATTDKILTNKSNAKFTDTKLSGF